MDPYRQQGYPQGPGYPAPMQGASPYGAPPPAGGYGYPPPPAGYPGGRPTGGYVQPPPPMGIAGVPPGAGPQGAPYKPYGAPQGPRPANYDAEAAQAASYAASFAEKKVRSAFVRKVFLLVFAQLALTIGVAAVFLFVDPVNEYIAGEKFTCTKRNSDGELYTDTCRRTPEGAWVFYVSWVLTLVMLVALMCSTRLRRRHPYNYMAMFAFAGVMSVQVGCICAWWSLAVVLQAVAVTGAAVTGLTLAAVFLPWDLTKRGNVLAMAGMVVFFVALITFFVGFFYVSRWWYLAISVVFALLFSAYLVYDIQMVMGGKTFAISPDEYVFAAVQIYLDIVLLFLSILQILGIAQS